jgi:hypothetical protein
VLALCAEAGLVGVGVIAVDGTKVHANASRDATRGYEQIAAEILAEADAADRAEDERYGEQRGDELPAEFSTAQGRRGWLREAKKRLEDRRAEPHLDFTFRLVDVHAIARMPARRMDVKMTYKHKPWATLRLEASPPETDAAEPEQIAAFSLTQLGLDGPDQVACQSLRYQIATKLHAVTERFEDWANDRYRDLIDLLLLAELQPDLAKVAEACEHVHDLGARPGHPRRRMVRVVLRPWRWIVSR